MGVICVELGALTINDKVWLGVGLHIINVQDNSERIAAWRHLVTAAVGARIEYKLCLLVRLALAGKAPTYITFLLQPITACPRSMTLRTATDAELFAPRSRLKFGERAFRISPPKAWNCLPHDIRPEAWTNSFKRKRKTFLFERHYCLSSRTF